MYWKIYIYAVKSQWNKISDQHSENVLREAEIVPDENVIVVKKNDGIIPISKIDDYCYRGQELEHLCVHDFVLSTVKNKLTKNQRDWFIEDNKIIMPKVGGGISSMSDTSSDTLTEESLYSDSDTAISSEDISDDGDSPKKRSSKNTKRVSHEQLTDKPTDELHCEDDADNTHEETQQIQSNFVPFKKGHIQQDSHYITIHLCMQSILLVEHYHAKTKEIESSTV